MTTGWRDRPADAHPAWPADELRIRPRGVAVALRLDDGGQVVGFLDAVSADELEVDAGDGVVAVATRSVVAFALAE